MIQKKTLEATLNSVVACMRLNESHRDVEEFHMMTKEEFESQPEDDRRNFHIETALMGILTDLRSEPESVEVDEEEEPFYVLGTSGAGQFGSIEEAAKYASSKMNPGVYSIFKIVRIHASQIDRVAIVTVGENKDENR